MDHPHLVANTAASGAFPPTITAVSPLVGIVHGQVRERCSIDNAVWAGSRPHNGKVDSGLRDQQLPARCPFAAACCTKNIVKLAPPLCWVMQVVAGHMFTKPQFPADRLASIPTEARQVLEENVSCLADRGRTACMPAACRQGSLRLLRPSVHMRPCPLPCSLRWWSCHMESRCPAALCCFQGILVLTMDVTRDEIAAVAAGMPAPTKAANITYPPQRAFGCQAVDIMGRCFNATQSVMYQLGYYNGNSNSYWLKMRQQPAANAGKRHADTANYDVRVCQRWPRDGQSVSYLDLHCNGQVLQLELLPGQVGHMPYQLMDKLAGIASEMVPTTADA